MTMDMKLSLWQRNILNQNMQSAYMQDARYRSPMQQEVEWYSQLILRICLHKAHRYEPRPAIPIQPSEPKWKKQFDLLLGNGWVLHKVLKWYLTRGIDMNLDPLFLHNPLNKTEETNLIHYSETVRFYTRFWNYISQLILWICLRKGHGYELRPAIPGQPSEQKWRKQFGYYYPENCWVLHKVLAWYLPTDSAPLFSQRP